MKNKGFLCLVLCLILVLQVFPVFAETDSSADLSVQSGCHTIDAQMPVLGTEQIITNAASVLLYETTTDTLMYAWKADDPLYPASLVKIMTALIVLEQGELSDVVTVTEDVLKTVDASAVTAQLKAEEEITVENLLYCMLVDSANDAAAVLADHVLGSQDAFVAEMNRYAKELGCTGTQFTNVHGLHDENQYTTARDMGRILREALKSEQFRTIFGTVRYTVPSTNKSDSRKLETGNLLMNREQEDVYYDGRVTGGRTGMTTKGDRCIATSAKHDDLEFICIVMGADAKHVDQEKKVKSSGGFPETSRLLDLGFKDYKPVQIIYDNQTLKQYSVVNGASDVFVSPTISVSTVLPADVGSDGLMFQYKDVSTEFAAPIEKEQKLSTVEIWYDDTCLAQADLYAMNGVKEKRAAVTEQNTESSSTLVVVLLGTIGVLVVFLLYLSVSRLVSKRRMAAQRRKNSKSHRRSR